MGKTKLENNYPRIFAITLAILTSIIGIYTVVVIIGEFHTILPISKSGYIYLLEKGCIIVSLLLLIIYLLFYYGCEKSKLYSISLSLLIVYLSIPVIVEIKNSSFDFLPSKLALAKMVFRIIMIMAVFLLLAENCEKREGKIRTLIFGTIFLLMFLSLVISTSIWITGGYEDKRYFWRTVWEELVKNSIFLPYIFCSYFCSKSYLIITKKKESK